MSAIGFEGMTAADVVEALVEDGSLLDVWKARAAELDAKALAAETRGTAEATLRKLAGDAGVTFGPGRAVAVSLKPSLRLVVVPSSQVPEALSLRPADADGRPTGHLKNEFRDAGFKPGDLVEVVLIRAAEGGGL